ncbi:cytochrome b6-f complex iron-sulfur subunit, partial [Nannochloropsis oceanica]
MKTAVVLATLFCGAQGFLAPSLPTTDVVARSNSGRLTTKMAEVAGEEPFVPDMDRRKLMNSILLGSVGLNVAGLAVPYIAFFVPRTGGGAGGGLVAKDALGDDVKVSGWLATHQAGDRSLVQGLKGDATYLIVKEDKTIENYGLNAVCTHLGCVVPWNKAENKFMCPCHGSQYDKTGKVVEVNPLVDNIRELRIETEKESEIQTPNKRERRDRDIRIDHVGPTAACS